jgi:tRNA-Thr(GGU) m(6)t(6)A37 methyltransferase TsaA
VTVAFSPIGILHSPFREKFGIPRQPGLAPHAISRLTLLPAFANDACLDGLAGFSHLWLLFHFHGTANQGWQPTVRPPRLGGNERLGVFATRSMFRPNPVGLSAVELIDIVDGLHGKELVLRGADLLDGTPILDIKPYVPYADAIPDARAGFAPSAPSPKPVQWTALAQLQADTLQVTPLLRALIEDVLAQDPRPAYRDAMHDTNEYGVWLDGVNVLFCCTDGVMHILALEAR